ncbi:unnamed protein product [Alopecurus aequalis]
MAEFLNRGRLPSILLAQKPRFTASTNDTTAIAVSKGGYTMAVSFWIAEPPELSLFSIHCTKPNDPRHRKHSDFSILPRVVGADGPFVLLRATFYRSSRREYFLYTAGDRPTLKPIPSPDESDDRRVREFGILGHGGGGQYLLADLHDAPSSESDDGYQLRIYSSETKSWSTRTLRNPCPGVDRVIPDKVITLGRLVGWVDLSHGLLVCDLLLLLQHQDQEPPVPGAVSFIPLPQPLPGNMYKLKYPIPPTQNMTNHPLADKPSRSASWFRDLAYVNGVLKFVEMENPPPPVNKDNIIYDSDMIMLLKHKAVDGNSKQQLSSFRDAWRAVTWTREVSSLSNFWRQTSSAPFADIKGRLMDYYSAFPILSPDDHGDDSILYLNFLKEPSNQDGWVAALDIGNMTLTKIGQCYLPDDSYYNCGYDPEHPLRACTLSRHLDMTPGIRVSECHKITEDSSSANHPSESSIHVGSCEQGIAALQMLSELAGKFKRPRNAAESIIQNDHISQVHPIENNLTQQHKLNVPPGSSLWPHQSNLPRKQCFNKPNEPSGPGYAPLPPVHGGYDCQPLWPHQLTSSSEVKPHEAPQPYFISCDVASLPWVSTTTFCP